jgi:hypothetical protein
MQTASAGTHRAGREIALAAQCASLRLRRNWASGMKSGSFLVQLSDTTAMNVEALAEIDVRRVAA